MDERLPGDHVEMSEEVLDYYLRHGDPLAANDPRFPDENPGGEFSSDRVPLEPSPILPRSGSAEVVEGEK